MNKNLAFYYRINIRLIINTLFYLKPKQVYYRAYYFLKNKFTRRDFANNFKIYVSKISWHDSLSLKNSYHNNLHFNFLNHSHEFKCSIDWNFKDYGKLWTYNLNYFEYLNQDKLSKSEGLYLINVIID